MIEPIFEREPFRFTHGNPSIYTLPSDGSGKDINVHFCSECGTKLALTFERWPDRLGIYVGTLDRPTSISVTPENSKHIFLSEARPGTIVPPGFLSTNGMQPRTTVHPSNRTCEKNLTWLRVDSGHLRISLGCSVRTAVTQKPFSRRTAANACFVRF
ncbi:GFA family protein [Sulfitobacter sediminilitoris]|uniref:GFA family protein n=1 Tax=Sulfitobacter sediminilitoris TaxID=2698830 RepID=UPI00361AF21F